MPAGKPWLQRQYNAARVPTTDPLFHVYKRRRGPLTANRYSEGRFALASRIAGESSDFGMFYTSTSLAGALWEVVLRDVWPHEDRTVTLLPATLEGYSVATLQLVKSDVPLIDLGQPGLRALYPDLGCDESREIARLRETDDYDATHAEAWQLHRELLQQDSEMPFLSWPSRMHSASTVYLGYQPPMQPDWWNVIDGPTDLDSTTGHQVVREVLAQAGYVWLSLETDATPPEK